MSSAAPMVEAGAEGLARVMLVASGDGEGGASVWDAVGSR